MSDSARNDIAIDNEESPKRTRRGRGGLGRGLGALIPTAEDEQGATPARPLDVLFPDLQRNSGSVSQTRSTTKRGGSARDLLEPRRKTANVSRETKAAPASKSAHKHRKLNSGVQEASEVTDSQELAVNVSRETKASMQESSSDVSQKLKEVPGASFGLIDTAWIIPNLKQPRSVFDAADLQELADSIAEVGVLQPIVLRRITEETLSEEGQRARLRIALEEQPEARYEIIMGERRWRASQLAGMASVPAIIRNTEEDDLLRDALIENLHRVQLNPLEEAAAYGQLMEDFSCTQEELSKRIARSRPQIANTLRLLRLPASVQRQLASGVISAGHARALLSLETPAAMEALASRIVAEGLSVRATEEQVKFGKQQTTRGKRTPLPVPVQAQRVADAVSNMLETSVSVSTGAKRGKLVIEFADLNDLDRIAAALGLSK